MALCFAHTAGGYLAYEFARPAGAHSPRLFAAAILLANAPDLDFVPGIVLGDPGIYHRGVTHTVVAALAVTLVVAGVGRLGGWPERVWRRAALWAGATYSSHLFLDFITTDAVAPYGARFLWPLSDGFYLAPFTPLREIIIDCSGRAAFFLSLVGRHTFGAWASDAGVLLACVVGVHLARAGFARAGLEVRGVLEGP